MDFDQLVRKYLTGALTDAELEQFRDLLDRVPEYRIELRQILELRSLIHDDALTLTPPEDLSEHTREVVGRKFAEIDSLLQNDAMSLEPPSDLSEITRMAVARRFAGAPEPVRRERRKDRRAIMLPFRISSGAFVAASVAFMIAFSPTLNDALRRGGTSSQQKPVAGVMAPSASTSGTSNQAATPAASERALDGAALAMNGARESSSERASENGSSSGTTTVERQSQPDVAHTTSPSVSTERASSTPSEEVSQSGMATDLAAAHISDGVRSSVADTESSVESISGGRAERSSRPDLLNHDVLALIQPAELATFTYQPASDSATHRTEQIPMIVALTSNVSTGLPDADARKLSVGLTLGSGNVVDTKSPTILLQSSCYFSYHVSSTDRIGVEMGGSTFLHRDKNSYGAFSAFAKKTQGGGQDGGAGNGAKNGVTPYSVTPQLLEQQVTYGGIFYDRRIPLNRSWDLCGRVTVGGADNAVLGSVRAYAAYSPSQGVTLTMGVGGSTLYMLSSRKSEGSGNYGVYYGVETGF